MCSLDALIFNLPVEHMTLEQPLLFRLTYVHLFQSTPSLPGNQKSEYRDCLGLRR
jgi:hypothetical protein